MKNVYTKRVNTINERYGTQFTWEEFKAFFDSNAQNIMSRQYGSKTSLLMIGKAMKSDDKLFREITDFTKNHSVNESEEFVNSRLKRMGLSRSKLVPRRST